MKNRYALLVGSMLSTGLVLATNTAHAIDFSNSALSKNPNATQDGSCYRIPATINATRGDMVFSSAPSSVVADLMHAIGQTYTHIGMALDSGRIRHNTMDPNSIGREPSKIPDHFRATGTNSMRDGAPGIITQTVRDAYASQTFYLSNGLVMSGTDPNRLGATAAQIEAFKGYYRLYAYTNPFWQDPYTLTGDSGNMCSGTLAIADIAAGNGQFWGTLDYDADTRMTAAHALHDSVRSKIMNKVQGYEVKFDSIAIPIDPITGSISAAILKKKLTTFADNGSNQIVNCMAFDDCGNTGGGWQNGVGTGSTISPDDILYIAEYWALVAASAGVADPFNYTTLDPVTVTGTFYCCNGTCTAKTGTGHA
jgi:hypothetical protein